MKEENGNNIYSVKETLIYARTINGKNPQLDTIITQFKIIEDNSHKITIKLYPWDGISFNRYLDPRQGEIIELIFYTAPQCKISLKKNVGLYILKTYDSAHLWSKNYKLIE